MKSKREKEKTRKPGGWKAFLHFVRHARIAWGLIICGMVVSFIASAVTMRIPDATGKIYAGDFSVVALLGLLGTMLLSVIVNFAGGLVTIIAQAKSTKNIRTVIWKRMMNLSAASKEARNSDQLLTTMTVDATNAVTNITMALIAIPASLYFIYLAIFSVASMSSKLVWPVFCLVPVYLIYGVLIGRLTQKTNYRIQASIGSLTGYLSERLRNLDVIKAYSNEEEEEKQGMQTAEKLYRANCMSVSLNTLSVGYILVSDLVAVVLAIAVGSSSLRGGDITSEEWMAFFIMMPMVNSYMRSVVQMWINLKGALGYTTRLAMVMEAPQERMGGERIGKIGDITFHDVSFSYEENKVLDRINLTLPAGKQTAIVGASGSGKTTLLNLVERVYVPEEGTIAVSGMDLEICDIADYRSKISYIQQDAGMFSGTIREALLYGVKREVSEEELQEACRLVGVWKDVERLPGKMEAPVALWGESLSGGQRQKLVIARELLRDAQVILLDEPTSSLDAGTAKEVYRLIEEKFADRTMAIVTHSLALIAKADQIVVMEKGTVADIGSHDELMNRCSIYQHLVNEQAYEEVYQS